jgi:hypothetical protein
MFITENNKKLVFPWEYLSSAFIKNNFELSTMLCNVFTAASLTLFDGSCNIQVKIEGPRGLGLLGMNRFQ